jgi:hypothetical protein
VRKYEKEAWGATSGFRIKSGEIVQSIYVFCSKRDKGYLQDQLLQNPNTKIFSEDDNVLLPFLKKNNI